MISDFCHGLLGIEMDHRAADAGADGMEVVVHLGVVGGLGTHRFTPERRAAGGDAAALPAVPANVQSSV